MNKLLLIGTLIIGMVIGIFFQKWNSATETESAHVEHAHENTHDESHDKHKGSSHAKHEALNHDEHSEHKEHLDDDHAKHGEHSDNKSEDEGHGEHSGHEESDLVKLSKEQIQLAKIKVSPLTKSHVADGLQVSGEITRNIYKDYLVSARNEGLILKLHVKQGQYVTKGQALITLSSEVIAQAQIDYRLSMSEWQRVQKLGKDIVSAKRYNETLSKKQAAFARLKALGLSSKAIQDSLNNDNTLGQYTLYAGIGGIVYSDGFHRGQYVNTGQTLIELADNKTIWVKAWLGANQTAVKHGQSARIRLNDKNFSATVQRISPQIKTNTRMREIFLQLDATPEKLDAGQFVQVTFSNMQSSALLLPESALMQTSEGEWYVFIEKEKHAFERVDVVLGETINGQRVITKGLSAQTPVVIEGAFFIASQQAKSNFDPHNH